MRRFYLLAVVAVSIASLPACRECTPAADFETTAWYPRCGPVAGGTRVEVRDVDPEGVESIRIRGASASKTVDEVVRFERGVSFVMPPWPVAEVVSIGARVSGTVECEEGGNVTVDAWDGPPFASFEYVDADRPEIVDADRRGEGTNPFEFEGNCGGGYWRRLDGRNFGSSVGDVVVEWGGEIVTQVEVIDDESLRLVVPRGAAGTWVEDIRVHKTYGSCGETGVDAFDRCDCGIHSPTTARFWYRQDPCVVLPTSAGMYEIEPGPHFLDIGDILRDADAENDLALVASDPTGGPLLVTFAGDGSGDLERHGSIAAGGSAPAALVLANLDGNEFADAVIAFGGSAEVGIFFNAGEGFDPGRATFLPTSGTPVDVATGDFDGDGDLDVAVANRDRNVIDLFRQAAPGEFSAEDRAALPLPAAPSSLDVGRFHGRRGADLVVSIGGNIALFHSTLDPDSPLRFAGTTAITIAPDGILDLGTRRRARSAPDEIALVHAGAPSSLFLLTTNPDGTVEIAATYDLSFSAYPQAASMLRVGDLDGVGGLDVVVLRSTTEFSNRLLDWFLLPVNLTDPLVGTGGTGFAVRVSDLALGPLNSNDRHTFDDLAIGAGERSPGVGYETFAVLLNDGAGFD